MLRYLEIRAQELSAVPLFVFVVLLGLTTTAFAQQLRDAPEEAIVPPANSVIRGRVTYADSGLPVRRAPVGLADVSDFVGSATRFAALRGGDVSTNYFGLTNDAGEYEVRGIPKGVYYLWVFAPNVLQPSNVISFYDNDTLSGVANFDRFFERVETDGLNEVHLDVQASRGGAISGVVTYEDGSLAPGIEVTVFRRSDDRFADGLTSISSTRTDDRGAFRITSLLPGSYLLRYRQQADHTGGGRTENFPNYIYDSNLVEYFPMDPRSKDAEKYLSVPLGEEITADKILLKRGLYSISGRVFDRSTLEPVEGIVVRFGRINSAGEISYDSENRSISSGDGGWSFKDLLAGKYFLKAESTEKWGQPFGPVVQELEIKGESVEDVEIGLPGTAVFSGRIVSEDEELPNVRIALADYERQLFPAAHFSPKRNNDGNLEAPKEWRFEVRGISGGAYDVRIRATGRYAKSVRINGKEIKNRRLTLSDSEVVEGVEILLSGKPGTFIGRILDVEGKPQSAKTVALIPIDAATHIDVDHWFWGQTNLSGEAEILAAPGEYFVVMPKEAFDLKARQQWVEKITKGAPKVSIYKEKTTEFDYRVPTAEREN